jgi:hypothetical protein
MKCSWRARVQRLLIGVMISHLTVMPVWLWTTFLGVRSPWDGQSASILTAWAPGGPDLLWRTLPLPGRAYPMLERSWWLYMFLWKSCYVRRWWDGFQHSSVCCQARVGACGYVLSCLALNGIFIRGPWPSDHLPSIWWGLVPWVPSLLDSKERNRGSVMSRSTRPKDPCQETHNRGGLEIIIR